MSEVAKQVEARLSEAAERGGVTSHTYFVSYAHLNGFGWITVTRPRPIRSGDELTELSDLIESEKDYSISLINIQPLPIGGES